MDRKRLDINDYQNASDSFKKDVAFANAVLDKVYAKINEQSQTMLDDAVKAKPNSGFVHSTENVKKPKHKWFVGIKREVAKKLGLAAKKGKIIVVKNNAK